MKLSEIPKEKSLGIFLFLACQNSHQNGFYLELMDLLTFGLKLTRTNQIYLSFYLHICVGFQQIV